MIADQIWRVEGLDAEPSKDTLEILVSHLDEQALLAAKSERAHLDAHAQSMRRDHEEIRALHERILDRHEQLMVMLRRQAEAMRKAGIELPEHEHTEEGNGA